MSPRNAGPKPSGPSAIDKAAGKDLRCPQLRSSPCSPISSILRRDPDPTGQRDPLLDVLQAGHKQVAAGYVVYGSSTVLVYTAGHGVHGFTLDPSIGAFVISHPDVKMPPHGSYYSVNEA